MTIRYDQAQPLDPAVDNLLDRMEHIVLGTLRADGSPQASTLWYLWTGKRFLLSTQPGLAKWKNLQRDPRCSLCVDDPATGEMAVAYGRADLIVGAGVEDLTRRICEKYYPNDPDLVDVHLGEIFSKQRSVISVTPESVVARTAKTRRTRS